MSSKKSGIFITKGMNISMKEFSLSINDNGKIETNTMVLHTGLNMSPYWIDIAYAHLLKTEKIQKKLIKATDNDDSELIGKLLQKEFTAGMQAVMGACIAIDAYYATIKDYSNIPDDETKKWRTNRTARYKQIAETFKRAFSLSQDDFLQTREVLKQCFELRDKAVHPKSGTDQPVLHPEINIISDWRYSAFRYANAKEVVSFAFNIIYQTANKKIKGQNSKLKSLCEKTAEDIHPILIKWNKKHEK